MAPVGWLSACLLTCLVSFLAGTAAQKSCANGCTERGNCNIEEGRCECMWGWTGPACDVPLFPACQLGPWSRPYHGIFIPKNCECYRQLIKHFGCDVPNGICELPVYQLRQGAIRCYQYMKLLPSEQRSIMPSNTTKDVAWFLYQGGSAFTRTTVEEGLQAVNIWSHSSLPLPQQMCPNNCSGDGGSCIKGHPEESWASDPPHCECHKGYHGHDCSMVETSLCPNECNKRGKCIVGFCHCEPPYFGSDCSRSKAFPPNPQAIAPRTRPSIYIYELPHWLSSPIELDDNLGDRTDIYMANEWFLSSVLKDWTVRTEDPWNANLFYIPAHTYSYSSNTQNPAPHIKRVITYLRTTFPFFNRSEGKDHFIWATGDRGSCYSPPEMDSVIKLVHFGYHLDMEERREHNFLVPRPHNRRNACLHPLRDVVAPPYTSMAIKTARETYSKLVAAQGVDAERTNLFFFAGGVRKGDSVYSGGARQAVHALVSALKANASANSKDVVFIEGHTPDYAKLYATTKFCLAPHGAGFGIRLSLAMMQGCVPVIVQDHVAQPLEADLPYHEFTLRIPKSDIPRLVDILRAVPEPDLRRLRLGMAKYHNAFCWEPELGCQAYNYTILALHRRLLAHWSDLYRHRSSSRRTLQGGGRSGGSERGGVGTSLAAGVRGPSKGGAARHSSVVDLAGQGCVRVAQGAGSDTLWGHLRLLGAHAWAQLAGRGSKVRDMQRNGVAAGGHERAEATERELEVGGGNERPCLATLLESVGVQAKVKSDISLSGCTGYRPLQSTRSGGVPQRKEVVGLQGGDVADTVLREAAP